MYHAVNMRRNIRAQHSDRFVTVVHVSLFSVTRREQKKIPLEHTILTTCCYLIGLIDDDDDDDEE